jgi:hypothetical protein
MLPNALTWEKSNMKLQLVTPKTVCLEDMEPGAAGWFRI